MEKLNKKLMQIPRKPAQLHQWAKDTIKMIGSTPEGRSIIRFRKGLAKPLVEEVLPLGIFAIKHYGCESEVTISPVLGNQNYDAIVYGDENCIIHVEVTQAHEGENDHLRMLELDKNGFVPASGVVEKQGTKNTGITVSFDEEIWRTQEEIRDEEFERIRKAVLNKADKSYRKNTALVVMFPDYLLPWNQGEDTELKKRVNRELLPKLKQFVLVAFVGSSGRAYQEYCP